MAAVPPLLDAAAMARFERDGFAVVTLPLSDQELQAASEAWDRNTEPIDDDPGYTALISHPSVEAIAKQVLRAERVFIMSAFRAERPGAEPGTPPPTGPANGGFHTDVQVTAGDWEATPRRAHLAIWIWVDDVTPSRAAIRMLPGSHRTLGAHWEATLAKHRNGESLPRPRSGQHGPFAGDLDQADFPVSADFPVRLGRLPSVGPDGLGSRPFPVSARRGQALVFTPSLVSTAAGSRRAV